MRLVGRAAELLVAPRLVLGEVALEPAHLAVALEGEDVRGEAVEVAELVRREGLMQLLVFGNIVTAWSWFGTNLLGVGLHSYGFTESGFFWLCVFGVSQVLLLALGWLPARRRFEPLQA